MRLGRIKRLIAAASGAISIGGWSLSAAATVTCAGLSGTKIDASAFSLTTTGATLTATAVVAATPPGPTAVGEYCRVSGAIHPVDPTAPDIPKAPDILFQINLPTSWNGKALHFGGGGYNGTVITGIGNLPVGPLDKPVPLGRGYATFGSDSGHEAAFPFDVIAATRSLDARFGINDEALQNFAGDALKKVRDAAVHIIELHYGQGPQRTYFVGQSTGGREAMAVTQRWPESYDGAIALFPAWNAASLDLQFGRISRALAEPGAYPNNAKKKLLYDAVMAECDKLDGLADGVISHLHACKFKPKSLRCPGGADTGDACLSDAQIHAMNAYDSAIEFAYPVASGETRYPGFNVYAGADTRGFLQLGSAAPAPQPADNPANLATMPYLFNFWDGWIKHFVTGISDYDSLQFDPQAPGKYQERISELTQIQDVNSTDLSAFASRGGKLLLAHGTADALVSTRSSEDYFKRLIDRFGVKGTRNFVRYYEIPGLGHAITGSFIPGWDSLKTLEDWVENGIAPPIQEIKDTVQASSGRTRPLCEYPKWPRYNGSGDPNSASSFTCVKAPSFRGYDGDDAE